MFLFVERSKLTEDALFGWILSCVWHRRLAIVHTKHNAQHLTYSDIHTKRIQIIPGYLWIHSQSHPGRYLAGYSNPYCSHATVSCTWLVWLVWNLAYLRMSCWSSPNGRLTTPPVCPLANHMPRARVHCPTHISIWTLIHFKAHWAKMSCEYNSMQDCLTSCTAIHRLGKMTKIPLWFSAAKPPLQWRVRWLACGVIYNWCERNSCEWWHKGTAVNRTGDERQSMEQTPDSRLSKRWESTHNKGPIR